MRVAAVVLFASVLLFAPGAHALGTEPVNMSFEEAPETPGGPPPGWWFIQHAGPPSFEFVLDDRITKDGKKSLRIRRTGTQPFGLVSQRIAAEHYRGKRVRLSAFLRLENVESYGRGAWRDMSGAVLMLRSQGVLDDMRDRPLRGTKPWTKVSVEIDVPPGAGSLEFAPMLSGTGTLWATDFKLEVVPPAQPKPQ